MSPDLVSLLASLARKHDCHDWNYYVHTELFQCRVKTYFSSNGCGFVL